MSLVPLNLAPGMYKNGTPYGRKLRWTDGNLVRWHDGSIRPIGGWSRRIDPASGNNMASLISTPADEAVRDMFAWRDNSQSRNTVFGSNLAVYHMDEVNVITDITPGAYVPINSSKDASLQAGYGQNPYGTGAFGAANNLIGDDPTPPDRWYFDNFGEVLLFGSRSNGDLFELNLSGLTTSTVTNAPTNIQAMCVTDQRQVFTVGGDGQPRRVQASDAEDRTAWTPETDNQAIDRTLPGTGKLMNCVPVLRQVLILGETDAHVANYIGPPYVFSIDLVGEKCGPIAAESVVKTDRFAVWWGARNFWIYDGAVDVLPCEVIDFLYKDLDPIQVSKISAYTNTEYSEITWLYQSLSSTTMEVDSYVTWDYRENHWTVGRLDRTAGIDKGVLSTPVMVASEGEIYNHELDDVLPTGDVFVESGAIDIGNGDQNMAVRYIYPDTESMTSGNISFTLIGRAMPQDTEYNYGPYVNQDSAPIPTRAMGRSIKLRADIDDADGEIGVLRLDIARMGTGRR